MNDHEDKAYALMRIAIGFGFFWHGSQKLFGFPPGPGADMNALLYTAGGIELVGGALVTLGLFTSWAAFLCSGLMAAAYWMAHGFNAPLPIQNHGELAFLYCFAFLFISSRGSGIWSVDAVRA